MFTVIMIAKISIHVSYSCDIYAVHICLNWLNGLNFPKNGEGGGGKLHVHMHSHVQDSQQISFLDIDEHVVISYNQIRICHINMIYACMSFKPETTMKNFILAPGGI